MPAIAEIRASATGAARLRGVLDLIGDEASSDGPGRSLILERLLEQDATVVLHAGRRLTLQNCRVELTTDRDRHIRGISRSMTKHTALST